MGKVQAVTDKSSKLTLWLILLTALAGLWVIIPEPWVAALLTGLALWGLRKHGSNR